MQTLRPALYECLRQVFGRVRIKNPGQSCSLHTEIGVFGDIVRIDTWGETFVVNCPFCNDNKSRLYINHLWGSFHPETDNTLWHLVKCFNEDCLADFRNREELARRVLCETGMSYGKSDIIMSGTPARKRGHSQVRWPGLTTPLRMLQPNHPAREYLEKRGFDSLEINRKWGVGYCSDPMERHLCYALNTLIIPVYLDSKMIGWQARYLGEKVSWQEGAPKYFTMPDFAKSEALYNLDGARQYPYVVVVEGVTTVWRYGDEAVATFGKDVSRHQEDLLVKYWGGGVVVVLLDADATEKASALYDRLSRRCRCVVMIQVNNDIDLGALPTERLRKLVLVQLSMLANDQGLDVSSILTRN